MTNATQSSRRGGRPRAGSFGNVSSKSGAAKPPLQLLDPDGVDVTPRSLVDPTKRPTADDVGRKLYDAPYGGERSVVWGANQDVYRTMGDNGAGGRTMMGGDGATAFPTNFSRSMRGSAYSSVHMSMADDLGEDMVPTGGSMVAGLSDVQTLRRAEEREVLQDADLNKPVAIRLSETDTISLLDLPSTWAAPESEDAAVVAAENSRRDALAERLGASRDGLAERGMQTAGYAAKHKEAQVTASATSDAGVQASTHNLSDTMEALAPTALPTKSVEGYTRRAIQAFRGMPLSPMPAAAVEIFKDPLSASEAQIKTKDMGFGLKKISYSDSNLPHTIADDLARIVELPSFSVSCRLSERLVAHTLRAAAQKQYRHETEALHAIPGTAPEPVAKHLWTYCCARTEGRTVTAMCWNKKNPDILAVGYGSLEFGRHDSGLVCCWSIKNPEFPERIYETASSVTAVDFSLDRPSLLGVGLHDGNIAVYDVVTSDVKPILDSRDKDIATKHSQPVWDLKWVIRERMIGEESGEMLFSAATDGRVLQWSLHRGLEQCEILLAKRVTKEAHGQSEGRHKGNAKAAFMARLAGVMCLDFQPEDHNIYLIGTEDGNIHRCSCSYNEQFLSTYTGHTGTVHRVAWNAFVPHVFMTCSADWSVKLWSQHRETPCCTLQAAPAPVMACAWSSRCASMLASLSGGVLNVWDVAVRPMDPVISATVTEDSTLTTVAFATNADAILTGDSMGRVNVHLLCNLPDTSSDSPAEQAQRLNAAMQKIK